MNPPTLSRYSSFPRDTLNLPSAPIPIPHIRRVTDPPPRSPTRYDSHSDLIFEMSPHVPNETPLAQHRDAFALTNAEARFNQMSALSLASRLGYVNRPSVNPPPYWEEPFLYSIPTVPARAPLRHARTQSNVVYGSRSNSSNKVEKEDLTSVPPSPFSIKTLSSVEARSVPCSDISNSDQEPDEMILTTAFQQSLTSSSSSHSSASSAKVHFEHLISPPASSQNEKAIGHPIRMPTLRSKRSTIKGAALPTPIRTSAASPVISFAQAEFKQSPSSGMIARVVRVSKGTPKSPFRAVSPHPPLRGRRNSVLKNRGLKVSDEDIVGTLENIEKTGFERFLPAALLRRGAADENKFGEEMLERGRTRSRTRTGRRP